MPTTYPTCYVSNTPYGVRTGRRGMTRLPLDYCRVAGGSNAFLLGARVRRDTHYTNRSTGLAACRCLRTPLRTDLATVLPVTPEPPCTHDGALHRATYHSLPAMPTIRMTFLTHLRRAFYGHNY